MKKTNNDEIKIKEKYEKKILNVIRTIISGINYIIVLSFLIWLTSISETNTREEYYIGIILVVYIVIFITNGVLHFCELEDKAENNKKKLDKK